MFQYSLSELVRQLAFEDESEAGDFCVHYGLVVVEGNVVLDKTNYVAPEMVPTPRRSCAVVEVKIPGSYGEVGVFVATNILGIYRHG